jgi:hypothetical protein
VALVGELGLDIVAGLADDLYSNKLDQFL